MIEELKTRFSQFFKIFQDLADRGTFVDLHVGVVTSDYGAGATGAPGCQRSPGGDRGRLQPIGVAAAPACMPPIGANYVAYDFANGGAGNNLPSGQDLVTTFTCMASVGDHGCGFEHTLEAAYAALHNNLPENAGFLRDDALLTVVFLTNEDDASAPPDTDLYDKTLPQYGYLDSYRATRFGVLCGDGPGGLPPYGDSGGQLPGCRAAPDPPGKLYDVQRYIDFFNLPALKGGVKANPIDVVLVAIDAPSAPFEVVLSNPGTPGGDPYPPCGPLDENSNPPCVPCCSTPARTRRRRPSSATPRCASTPSSTGRRTTSSRRCATTTTPAY